METSPKPAAWTTYLAALTAASRLEDPSDEAMAAICPHLTPQAAVAAFRTGGDGHSSRVACPPLRAEELVHVFRYRKPHDGMPGRLEHECVERADILFFAGPHGEVARRYAQDTWGDQLVWDAREKWQEAVTFFLKDPSDLVQHVGHKSVKGSPRQVLRMTLGLDRGWQVLRKDRSRPLSELVERAVVEATTDWPIGHELLKIRYHASEHFFCAGCGDELQRISCAGCGHTFDDQETSPDSSCLGERLANLAVAAGISFQKDPAIARAAERARWEATSHGRRK